MPAGTRTRDHIVWAQILAAIGRPVKRGSSGSGNPGPPPAARVLVLRRRGYALEAATLAWNVVGVVVLAVIAVRTGSVAVAGFGLDSLIEIGASVVVIWELSGTGACVRRAPSR